MARRIVVVSEEYGAFRSAQLVSSRPVHQLFLFDTVGPPTASITASQNELGDSTTASVESLIQFTASQNELGDSTTASIESIIEVSASQTEEGDNTVVSIGVVAQFTASQNEAGDTTVAVVVGIPIVIPVSATLRSRISDITTVTSAINDVATVRSKVG